METTLKNKIIQIANERMELNQWKVEDGEADPKTFLTCLKEAILIVKTPVKKSNSMREIRGSWLEATEQKYNHFTKSYEKI